MRLKPKLPRSGLIVDVESLISENDEVRLIDDFVEKLDLASYGISYKTEHDWGQDKGGPNEYDPKDYIRIHLYGYLNKFRSSRDLEEACKKNIDLIWLINGQTPSHTGINNFRRDHPEGLLEIFKSLNVLWQKLGLFSEQEDGMEDSGRPTPLPPTDSSQTFAIDGSKFRGQNSKTRNYNVEKLEKNLERYNKKALAYLEELVNLDIAEHQVSLSLPKEQEAEKKKSIADRTQQITTKLEYINQGIAKNQSLLSKLEQSGQSQLSLTDPDARRLTDRKGSIIGYNVQISTEASHKLISHFQVTNQGDSNAFYQMAKATKDFLDLSDQPPESYNGLGDKGYCNGEQIYLCEQDGIVTYISHKDSTNGKKEVGYRKMDFEYDKEKDVYLGPNNCQLISNGRLYRKRDGQIKEYRGEKACQTCPFREKCLSPRQVEKNLPRVIHREEYEHYRDDNKERVANNKELYKKRKAIVEHPFGTIKRQWGYSYTLLKGFEKVEGEFALIFTAYNLRRAVTELGVNAIRKAINKVESFVFPLFFQN